MNSHRALDGGILIAATAFTRFAFRSHYLYDIDSINFALALERFDPSVHQPHPPGYFLYVYFGRLADLIFHDANSALVAISIVFSCGAAAAIYALADGWFERNAAIFAGLIFLFSPLAWFHGTVALTYIVEAFFSAFTGYLCWRIYDGATRFIVPAAIVVGIAAGFRPSSLLLLSPLLLFSFRNASRKQAATGVCTLIFTLLAWLIPMIEISGGRAYLSALVSLWLAVPSKGMVFNSSLWNSFARGWMIIAIYFLFFGGAAILPLWRNRGAWSIERRKRLFTGVWIAPGLFFFTFIYLKFVNSGYLQVLLPPVCAWMGLWASNWYANIQWSKATKILVVAGCVATNILIFMCAPLYCSYREVRRFEAELESIVRVLPQLASPKDTMIVGFDSHFLGYRHAGYYLPGYMTVQFPEVPLSSGTKVFAMRDRNTWLESRLPVASIHNFVIFPLPLGDSEYSDYVAQFRKRFPPDHLRTIVRDGHEFTVGPAADLRLLFPVSASPAANVAIDNELHAR